MWVAAKEEIKLWGWGEFGEFCTSQLYFLIDLAM
jgi:hypothetical protein